MKFNHSNKSLQEDISSEVMRHIYFPVVSLELFHKITKNQNIMIIFKSIKDLNLFKFRRLFNPYLFLRGFSSSLLIEPWKLPMC